MLQAPSSGDAQPDLPKPPGRRSGRARRLAVRAVAVVAALLVTYEAAWLVGGNWFLDTYAPPRLNRSPERLTITWESARRLFIPGRLEIQGLRMRVQNRRVQWEARLARGTVRVSLPSLLWRNFRVVGLDGEDCSIRLRFVPKEGKGAGVGSPHAPPIEGLPDPPLTFDQALPPRPRPRHPWSFELRRSAIEGVREIWVGPIRFTGDASIRVSLDATPRQEITAREFTLDVATGDLSVGDDPFVSALRGGFSCDVDRFEMAERPALDVLEEMSATAHLQGRLHDVQLPRARFPNVPWLGFGGGSGDGEVDVVLKDGVLAEGTRLRLAAEDFTVAFPAYEVQGTARVEGRVTEAEGGRVEARFDAFTMRREGAPSAHVQGDGFSARLATSDLTLRHPLETFQVDLDLPESRIVDFDSYSEVVPRPLRVRVVSGVGTLSGHLTITQDGGHGGMALGSRDLVLDYEGERLRGDFDLATIVRSADMGAGAFDLAGTQAHVRNGVSEGGGHDARGWWADATFDELTLTRGQERVARLKAHAKMRDSRPLVALMTAERPMIKLVRPALVAENVSVTAELEAGPDLVDVETLALDGDGLVIRACADMRGASRRGVIFVDSGMLSAGIRFADGRRAFKPFAKLPWYEAHAGLCDDAAAWSGD